jgi:hypothetical protein
VKDFPRPGAKEPDHRHGRLLRARAASGHVAATPPTVSTALIPVEN